MKKQIVLATVLAFSTIFTTKAQEVLSIEMNDNTVYEFKISDIREVNVRIFEEDPNCPVADAIDLGLPSGTRWATWNVGATTPEDIGGSYAWGETEVKDYYDWNNYIHCDGSKETCHFIGDDIAGTEYDVAHVKWGGLWRMPTKDQMSELRVYCTQIWTIRNGVNGIVVTGPSGSSIFMPVTTSYGTGDYWTSSPTTSGYTAWGLQFSEGIERGNILQFYRKGDASVRPVCK